MSSKKIFAGKRTDSTPFLVACHSVPKHGGLSPQLVCLLFRTVFPPIRPVGLTNRFDRKIGILTDFTGLSPSPKFGLFGPNLSMPVVGKEGNLNFYLAAIDFDSLAFAAFPRLVEAQ
jgi:hypothetical protein